MHKSRFHVGFINKKLKYMKVEAKSIGNVRDPKPIKEPIYNMWEKFLEDYRQKAPTEMRTVM